MAGVRLPWAFISLKRFEKDDAKEVEMVEKNGTDTLEKLKKGFTETEKVILSRRSVRLYKKEQVPEFMVKRILEAGRFAPSAGNFQPWKFIVLRDPEVINGITEAVISSCKVAGP